MQRFLLADDNSNLRSALRLMLETRLKSPLVFEAADHAGLIDQSMAHPPDCLILDWELPGFTDHHCLDALRDLFPDLKIIVTSAWPEAAEAALAAHADAFICKTDPPAEILHAIRLLNGKI
jgi:DNA-binding NarL/FixJ family response regulator